MELHLQQSRSRGRFMPYLLADKLTSMHARPELAMNLHKLHGLVLE